jgi:hypothetical protein
MVWAVACLAIALPAAIAFGLARGSRALFLAFVVAVGVTIWSSVGIPQPPAPSEGVTFFTSANVRSARQWILALGVGGALFGRLIAAAITGTSCSEGVMTNGVEVTSLRPTA